MTFERRTYFWSSLTLLVIISTYIFFYYQDRLSLQDTLTLSLTTLLLPFLISSSTLLFKKALFTPFLIGTVIVGFCFWTSIFLYIFSRDENEDTYTLPSGYVYQHEKVLVKFMEKETNSSYHSVLISSYYFTDSVTKKKYYILKNIYRIGDNHLKNYYITKVFIDNNFKVRKQFYNVQVNNDTTLFRHEYGRSFSAYSKLFHAKD